MKIAVLIEGQTERVFLPHLRRFLETRLSGRMPCLDPEPHDADRILRENDLVFAAAACPELRAFLNTILGLCGGECV